MLTVCRVLATIHARDRWMDKWIDRIMTPKIAEPIVLILQITICRILDNNGIPVEIHYQMNRHYCSISERSNKFKNMALLRAEN